MSDCGRGGVYGGLEMRQRIATFLNTGAHSRDGRHYVGVAFEESRRSEIRAQLNEMRVAVTQVDGT